MNSELPIQLYKANAELQLQITRLLQESGHHWLDAMQQINTGRVLESGARIQALQQVADWQALATLPVEVFWRLCQGQVGDGREVGEAATKSQTAFAEGLRQALATWQESVAGAFGASGDSANAAQLYPQWTPPWAVPAHAPQAKVKKRGGQA